MRERERWRKMEEERLWILAVRVGEEVGAEEIESLILLYSRFNLLIFSHIPLHSLGRPSCPPLQPLHNGLLNIRA